MPPESLQSLRDAVAVRPDDHPTRLLLVSALLGEGLVVEAFGHLGVVYQAAKSTRTTSLHVQAALYEIADELGRLSMGPPGWGPPERPAPVVATPPTPGPRGDLPPGSDAGPVGDGRERVSVGGREDGGGVEVEFVRPPVTLADVAGLDDVKRHIHTKLFAPMRNVALAERYGRTPTGGLLMWGPPGCGKTFIARALAGTLGVEFSAVGMDEILDMYIGQSEKNMATLFDAARLRAPCVLFFDETDAVGGRRSRMGVNVTMRSVVSQLLVELDGAVMDNTGVFTIGATNLPWDIDPALRRPGRFDLTLFVPPPDRAARIGILANRLSDAPLAADLNLARIADMTAGRSGADIGYIVDTAKDAAFNVALETSQEVPIAQRTLERAAAATGSTIVDWVRLATTAAEASDDAELYGPFLLWLDQRNR